MKREKRYEALTEQALALACGGKLSVAVFDSIDSTNRQARRMAASGGCSPTVIAANQQTAGRGRMGRTFYSPAEAGAYFTVLYPLHTELLHAVSITGAAAVAVMRAARRLLGAELGIKWVNDLQMEGKKVCGILCESFVGEDGMTYLAVGIGLNLYKTELPPELCGLADALNADGVSRVEMIAAIVDELLPFLKNPSDRSWLDDYRASSVVLGRRVTWIKRGLSREGIAEAINGNGELIVLADDGERVILRTGEISVRF